MDMSTDIVQIAYKKCLEMHEFVIIFFKKKSGRGPQTPPPPSASVDNVSAGWQ